MIKTFFDGMQLPVNPFEDITVKVQGNNKQFGGNHGDRKA